MERIATVTFDAVRTTLIVTLLFVPMVVAHAQIASPFGPAAAWLVDEGDSLLRHNKPQKALLKFNEALELDPTATNYAARARAWIMLDRMDRVLLDAEQALKLDSTHAEANHQRALCAFRSDDFRLADRLTTRALNNGARGRWRDKLLILRGESRAELKRASEAIADLKAGLGDRTDDLAALKTLARLLDGTSDHAASLAVLEKLCVVEPGDIGNWTNRGFELASLGRHQEALAIYAKALAMDKDEPTALSNRAWSLMELGRKEEALSDVQRSLRSYPANAFALRTRALLRIGMGQRDKACEDLHLARVIGGVADVPQLIAKHCAGLEPKR